MFRLETRQRSAFGFAGGVPLPRRGAIAAALSLCCVPAFARTALGFAEIAPGIHVRSGVIEEATAGNDDAIANIGFVIGDRAVAVFDPGGSLHDGEALRTAIRGCTDKPITHVIFSHAHPDHIFGAGAFLRDKPAFVAHARLPQSLAARGDFYRDGLDRILGAGRAGPIVAPTLLVRDTLPIALGGRILSLTAHPPAHSDCDLSALDSATGTLLAGDLLFVDRAPSLDGNLAGWLGVLAGLKTVAATQAVPGHGPRVVAWPASAANLERYLHTLQRETRRAVAAGMPIDQAARTVAQSERSRWRLFDDNNPRNVLEAYQQLEWE
jgi:quinoprotein relay system zinc metallohydrolase 2